MSARVGPQQLTPSIRVGVSRPQNATPLRFDWDEELRAITCPRLLYWGSEDRQMAKKLWLAQQRLTLQAVDFVEFEGLDHGACNTEAALTGLVIPAVVSWVARRLGQAW